MFSRPELIEIEAKDERGTNDLRKYRKEGSDFVRPCRHWLEAVGFKGREGHRSRRRGRSRAERPSVGTAHCARSDAQDDLLAKLASLRGSNLQGHFAKNTKVAKWWLESVAGPTGLEPATSGVTGR